MSLYRYLPYWKHVREDIAQSLAAVNDEAFDYTVHPSLPTVGAIVVDLASAQSRLLGWFQQPGVEFVPLKPENFSTRADKIKALEDQWDRLEKFSETITREDLTKPHPHPTEEGEVYTVFQLLWELMRYEIYHLGRIDLQVEAYYATHDG